MCREVIYRWKANSVLLRPNSPCYCLQWTKLLFRWTPYRQIRQRRGRKKDPNWSGLCPQDCPGWGRRADKEDLLYILYWVNIRSVEIIQLCFFSCYSPVARRPAQRIHIQRLLLSQWSVRVSIFNNFSKGRLIPSVSPSVNFTKKTVLNILNISFPRENPHFHP